MRLLEEYIASLTNLLKEDCGLLELLIRYAIWDKFLFDKDMG